jgi:hypothetical protein
MTTVRTACVLLVCVLILTTPRPCASQTPSHSLNGSAALLDPLAGSTQLTEGPWEATFATRIGFPVGGTLQSVDRPVRGTRFSLNDLGIDVSESLEGTVAYAFTPRDAVRASFVYYFLRGSSTQSSPFFYNGYMFKPGSLDTNADFYRISLAYERTLLDSAAIGRVVGSLGLTYAVVGPTLKGSGLSTTEGFSGFTYKRVLPVPIVGFRWDHQLAQNLILRTSFLAGALPRVDSLRSEEDSHTLDFEQADIDLTAGLAYSVWRKVQIEGGYEFSYFRQRGTSQEDVNLFELIDNGLYLRLSARF